MKLHPLSIPYRLFSQRLRAIVIVLIGGFAFSNDPLMMTGLIVLGVLAIAAVVAYEVAYYRRFEYALTDDSLDLHSGVFSRREREIPLRRVQNVDVTRPFVARLLGLAEVNVETAGGDNTEASLRYVGKSVATELQNTIRKRGQAKRNAEDTDEKHAPSGGQKANETAVEQSNAKTAASSDWTDTRAPSGETIFELTNRNLVLYGVLSFDLRLITGVIGFIPFIWPIVGDFVSFSGLGLIAGVALAIVGVLAVWAISATSRIIQFYNFRLRRVGDDLRYERGLLQRYDGTIPVSKLQTLTIEENILMRRYGFASLAVETAGYTPDSSPSGGSEAAVPIASKGEVLSLARTLEDFDEIELSRPPERVKSRYFRRYVLLVGVLTLLTFGISQVIEFPWYVALVFVPLALPAARLTWNNRGYDSGSDHAVVQAGFWRRQTSVVPYKRVQTIVRRQTIFQRRWGVTTVVLDTAGSRSISGSDPSALDRDTADANELADVTESRLLDAVGSRAGYTLSDR